MERNVSMKRRWNISDLNKTHLSKQSILIIKLIQRTHKRCKKIQNNLNKCTFK